jgi:hypothetical protein
VLAAALLAIAACGGSPSGPTPTNPSLVGRYTLTSAKGQSLPAVVYEVPSTGYKQEVTGGFIDLRANGSCAWATDYRYTDGGRTSTSSSGGEGTYTFSGDTVTMTFGADHIVATRAGDTLTVRADVDLVYRRL